MADWGIKVSFKPFKDISGELRPLMRDPQLQFARIRPAEAPRLERDHEAEDHEQPEDHAAGCHFATMAYRAHEHGSSLHVGQIAAGGEALRFPPH